MFYFNYRQHLWEDDTFVPENDEQCIILIQFEAESLNDMLFVTILEFIEANKYIHLEPTLWKSLLECLHRK